MGTTPSCLAERLDKNGTNIDVGCSLLYCVLLLLTLWLVSPIAPASEKKSTLHIPAEVTKHKGRAGREINRRDAGPRACGAWLWGWGDANTLSRATSAARAARPRGIGRMRLPPARPLARLPAGLPVPSPSRHSQRGTIEWESLAGSRAAQGR